MAKIKFQKMYFCDVTTISPTSRVALSSGVAWLTQPQRSLAQDGLKWRNFLTGLTPEQYDKVTKLLAEIETQQKADQQKGNKR